MPVIPDTQEAEIWRIEVLSQPGQIVRKTLSQQNPSQKGAGGVTQGIGPKFKPSKKRNEIMSFPRKSMEMEINSEVK
jgi:hypothetical protein